MVTYDEIIQFITDNNVMLSLLFLLIAVIYINMKINDLEFRVQQTIMFPLIKNNNRMDQYPSYSQFQSQISPRWF
jgi:hypothetical protein